ncbi:MAG: hypothetical protein KAT70_09650 [Thermoplasmata archaeon]|nr:hypothetical protein [Thermoplasmata archaeon]
MATYMRWVISLKKKLCILSCVLVFGMVFASVGAVGFNGSGPYVGRIVEVDRRLVTEFDYSDRAVTLVCDYQMDSGESVSLLTIDASEGSIIPILFDGACPYIPLVAGERSVCFDTYLLATQGWEGDLELYAIEEADGSPDPLFEHCSRLSTSLSIPYENDRGVMTIPVVELGDEMAVPLVLTLTLHRDNGDDRVLWERCILDDLSSYAFVDLDWYLCEHGPLEA